MKLFEEKLVRLRKPLANNMNLSFWSISALRTVLLDTVPECTAYSAARARLELNAKIKVHLSNDC